MRKILILALQICFLFAQEKKPIYSQVDSLIDIYRNLDDMRTYSKQLNYAKRELAGLNDMIEATEPLILPIKDITKVKVHPSKKLTIIFPPFSRIIEASPFPVSEAVTRKDFNTFDIASPQDLVGGEITVRYTINNDIRDIRVMKIAIDRYENIKRGKNIYYPIIKYTMTNKKNFDFETLIEEYQRLKGYYPKGTVFFYYRGVGVSLIEDNINGIYQLGNKRFRISTR